MQKTLKKQKTSFVSPSTKELQRKPLGNLKFFAYVLFLENEEKINEKIQRNVFLSISNTKLMRDVLCDMT